MVSLSGFSRSGKIYIWTVVVAGLYAIGRSLYQMSSEPIGYQWFILAALTLVSGSATVRLPSSVASVSISETFVFTAVLLYGPAAGTTIVALDALVISFWISKRQPELIRALFNMAAAAISAWLSANLFFKVAGVPPLVQAPSSLNAILPALILYALTYFGLNSWLIAIVISLERRVDAVKVWTSTFAWLSLNYFGGASVAILFVGYNRTIDLGYVGVIVPLLLVLWFTFRTTMARVEDADKHVEQLNKLYLSTIETLAMAIDAKDQVTHGHIRRVQSFATNLAREIGVRDVNLLKAIEAAALLHDMGKLAVPEYILNKPGKLSEAEFEKMKLHASVGAEILSAIDFPYPVVPIVRHHHENWDGSGYPDGLRGTEIPIGARILSVVDCFDALTSDRPYRPRLSDDEALKILDERRGKMYDPLVVDTFSRVHSEMVPEVSSDLLPSSALDEIASARKSLRVPAAAPVLDEIVASSDESLTMYELVGALTNQVSAVDATEVVASHLRRLIPVSVCVFYIYDSVNDLLDARYVIGQGETTIKGLKISLGQRLSGWVAANRQTIVNSDPTLDLGDVARPHALALKSCLSTPLLSADTLVGVLSLYVGESGAFNEDHKRIIEAVARQVAQTIKRTSESDRTSRRDTVTGLPLVDQLEVLLRSHSSSTEKDHNAFVLLIDVVGLNKINGVHGRTIGDEVLKRVAKETRRGLRAADVLFRYVDDEFVAFLASTDSETGKLIGARIRTNVEASPIEVASGLQIDVRVKIATLTAPANSRNLLDLLATARSAATEPRHRPDHLVH
jgi:diguanylate cyclase (GGDEF)-like protein/putative nucleotidyltransferase with HDIG domain